MALIAGDGSRSLFRRARRVMPGGVSSPVRAFQAVGGAPLVIKKGAGAEIEDVDGRRFVDFVGSWGPLILGHAHPAVVESLAAVARDGTTFGAPCRHEIELAERVVGSYPGLEQVRFVSSGTEATMSAIRLARGSTGRSLIVKFSGCYHGHADHLLVSAGSGLATFGSPSSGGVPDDLVRCTRVLPLDDEVALRELFEREGRQVAAVILEPLPANNGLLAQREDFLRSVREETASHGALLIFDEVISGFRIAPGGMAQSLGITPDLACFGKVIGGGLPVGGFGGPRDVMRELAPEGTVYQAGTLSGNPLAMAAGLATLKQMERSNGWSELGQLGESLERALLPVLDRSPIPVRLVRRGSIFWLSMQEGEVPRSAEAIDPGAAERYAAVFGGLLERGVYLAPSAYEVGFLSLAHDERHVAHLADALGPALDDAARLRD